MASNRTHPDAGSSSGGTDPPGRRPRSLTGPARPAVRSDVLATPLGLLTLTRTDGEMLVVAHGEIDVCTAPALFSGLDSALRHPSCRTLIADLRDVRFLGARGITVLLAIRRDADDHDVRLAVVADHSAVRRPLEVTATVDRLPLFPTVAAARSLTEA